MSNRWLLWCLPAYNLMPGGFLPGWEMSQWETSSFVSSCQAYRVGMGHDSTSPLGKSGDANHHQNRPPGQLRDIRLEKGNRFVTSLLNGAISSQSWGVPLGARDKITLLTLYSSCSEDFLVSNLRMWHNIKKVVGFSVMGILIYRFSSQRKQSISPYLSSWFLLEDTPAPK